MDKKAPFFLKKSIAKGIKAQSTAVMLLPSKIVKSNGHLEGLPGLPSSA